jgi:hypothetical protein
MFLIGHVKLNATYITHPKWKPFVKAEQLKTMRSNMAAKWWGEWAVLWTNEVARATKLTCSYHLFALWWWGRASNIGGLQSSVRTVGSSVCQHVNVEWVHSFFTNVLWFVNKSSAVYSLLYFVTWKMVVCMCSHCWFRHWHRLFDMV